jgi:hypothetical protein
MSTFGEGARQALGINGQPRSMRAVVGKYSQDVHKRGDYTLTTSTTETLKISGRTQTMSVAQVYCTFPNQSRDKINQ